MIRMPERALDRALLCEDSQASHGGRHALTVTVANERLTSRALDLFLLECSFVPCKKLRMAANETLMSRICVPS